MSAPVVPGHRIAERQSYAMRILSENKDKDFVQRLFAPGISPVVRNDDGSVSSHRMASAEVTDRNGMPKFIVYPTLVRNPEHRNQLIQLEGRDAVRWALDRGEFIAFPTDAEAKWFANNGYKHAFGDLYFRAPEER